ncbi:MAG: tRNA uridine(34) 5-carboxymethylaminomethyl modification radical SAM/GNAT enzyme Elp3 [Nanoarchaeota archaeon]|nr:tRNA uridine(34) 5-carboxymethylaminomethyl modification radical SAM/GNAT enzyme Elp3 [Nanoarchaeota archaeon]
MHSTKTYPREKPRKPVRSVSGVTPLTVVLKPRKCNHGMCIYCPGGDFVPQSYTDKSPAIMRALALNFDPYVQVRKRLEALEKMGHPTDKIEIIVLGGTFLQYDLDYQYDFIKKCFDALNGRDSENLGEAKKINETAKHRCVALCIENRPDNCSDEEIKRMLEFGCTRVEIGVQIPDDEIYRKINRGHSVRDVIDATKNLKNAGFKLGYHFMPGLPYSNPKKDLEKFKILFTDEKFRPDQLKIYPCQIVDDSPLAKIYKRINYKPYTTEQTKKLLQKMFPLIPEYCRIMRVMREIPKEKMVAEPIKLDLRKDIEENFKKQGIKIKEIRMREIGFNKSENSDLKLKILKYTASEGDEYFLEIVNENDVLFGLLRLRIMHSPSAREIDGSELALPSSSLKKSVKVIKNSLTENSDIIEFKTNNREQSEPILKKKAIIRELHVYGQTLNLGEKGEISQHRGIGKWLMNESEKIVKENKIKKVAVISGIGVREYYKKLGYEIDDNGIYMVKRV